VEFPNDVTYGHQFHFSITAGFIFLSAWFYFVLPVILKGQNMCLEMLPQMSMEI
jgi:hypothetical protein